MIKVSMSVLIVASMCVACQNTDANLRRETARSIGNLTPNQVSVYDVNRGFTNVDWKAKTPKGDFECFADDNVRRVNCVKK